MDALDEITPICADEMELISDRLMKDCTSRGMEDGIRDFLSDPFARWMDVLADESSALDEPTRGRMLSRDDAGALAAAMRGTFAVRDAMLVSIIVGERRSSREFLMGFMTHPTLPGNARRLEKLLNASFHDAAAGPDVNRCDNGVTMLFDIIDLVPEQYQVQPLAVISYVLWWMGDERAMLCAMRALALDEECSLAAIICSAMHRHIGPAWAEKT